MDSDRRWQAYLLEGITQMLAQTSMQKCIEHEHLKATPARFVKAIEDQFWGIHKDPAAELRTSFAERDYDQMVTVAHVEFQSFCAHHLCPFIGKYTFAYLPEREIVGLSKIPRMIEVLCARPQVQEQLSQQIVQTFMAKVQSRGCGVCIDAFHTCMCCRGVKKWATTRTVALEGCFKTDPSVKSEFLSTVGPVQEMGV